MSLRMLLTWLTDPSAYHLSLSSIIIQLHAKYKPTKEPSRHILFMLLIKLVFILALSTKVKCAIPATYEIGTTLSAISLALAIPHYFIFNTHLRILDFLQLAYLFSIVTVLPAFSNNLSATWLKFIPNFYEKFCDSDGYVCNSGYALSSGTVLIGIIILALTIAGIERCRKP